MSNNEQTPNDEDLSSFMGKTPHEIDEREAAPMLDISLAERQAQEDAEIEKEAQELYNRGEALKYMIDTCQSLHVGDRDIITSLILSYASTKVGNIKNGLHIRIAGDTGTGKTDAVKTVKKIIPKDYFPDATGLSDKALLYNTDIRQGSVLFIDDQVLSDNANNIMKAQTSDANEPYVYGTVINGKYTPLTIPERCVRWIALCDPSGDEQTADRELYFFIENTKEHREAIHQRIAEIAMDPSFTLNTRPFRVCKAIWSYFPTGDRAKVFIPYADKVRCDGSESDRTIGMIYSMIQASAILSAPRRKLREDGFMDANLEDFYLVSPIMNRILSGNGGSQKNKLTPAQEKILNYLKGKGSGDIPYQEICEELLMSSDVLSKAINGRKDRNIPGLLKIPGIESVVISNDGRQTKSISWSPETFFRWDGSKTYVYLDDEAEESLSDGTQQDIDVLPCVATD